MHMLLLPGVGFQKFAGNRVEQIHKLGNWLVSPGHPLLLSSQAEFAGQRGETFRNLEHMAFL